MPVTRRDAIRTFVAAAIGSGAGVFSHGYLYERHAIRTVRATLPVPGLHPSHEGLRIGLLTDVHHSEFVSQSDIARAVDQLLASKPDVIVLGGDYVSHRDVRYAQPCAEALAPLTARHGVFAILGNHDDEREMPAALVAQGFAVLKDARTTLRINGEPLDLAGIRFWTKQTTEVARVLEGASPTTLLLAHDPRRLAQAAALAVPAVLSGHTHGGQVNLPVLGPMVTSKFPVVAGLGERDGTHIFVSRGVGTVYVPVRINCPPEVAVVTLTGRPPRA